MAKEETPWIHWGSAVYLGVTRNPPLWLLSPCTHMKETQTKEKHPKPRGSRKAPIHRDKTA